MAILGVRIDNLYRHEILTKIESFLSGNKFCQIATINPEFILAAQKDVHFRNILNSCDLNIADGIGIRMTLWACGLQKLKCRIAGADLMNEILKIADERELRIFLAVNKNGLSSYEQTSAAIKKLFPRIKICGAEIIYNNSNESQKNNKNDQELYSSDILFCNFGAPFQEKFIHSLKSENCGNLKLAMGVGGSFDFLTGKQRRAPLWMRKIGLEWLYRLIQQPKRWRRIFNAVVIFPIKVMLSK